MWTNKMVPFAPKPQADAVLAQANPVSATLYGVGVFATPQRNVRIITIEVDVVWTVQPSPLEVVLTSPDLTVTPAIGNPVSATPYYVTIPGNAAAYGLSVTYPLETRSFLRDARSIMIQARTTGGTVQNLNSRVKWDKW